MIISMTGYGRGEAAADGIAVTVDIRSVNSRFLEVSARLPRSLSLRENEIKEVVRRRVSRAKINLLVVVERESNGSIPVTIKPAAAKAYYRLLKELRKTVGLKEPVKLQHLLQFSEIFEPQVAENTDEREWAITQQALDRALKSLNEMRSSEGHELEKDFRSRIALLQENLETVERLSHDQVPQERSRLRERIKQLLEAEAIDEGRLEMEIAMLADRVDVTEECVRFRSHNKFFLEAMAASEPAGRKLNFLIQEMNREANTIGSKSSSTEIAHRIVTVKEELERIREQLQNIE
jgi:uncharacterized protein (TIGR00255 family)